MNISGGALGQKNKYGQLHLYINRGVPRVFGLPMYGRPARYLSVSRVSISVQTEFLLKTHVKLVFRMEFLLLRVCVLVVLVVGGGVMF